jgi:hypothetical protein
MKSVMKSRILQALASRARVARVLAAVVVAGLLTAACGGSTEPGVTASVTIAPTTATIPVTGTQQFTVVVKNAAGDVLAVTPTWSIVSGAGTITQSGLFTAGTTPGTTVIAVTCSGITVNATITVTTGAAVSISLLPATTTLFPGQTQTFTATVKDGQGNVILLPPTWTVANPPGTIVANAGTMTAVFTAGNTLGTFNNSVSACVNVTLCATASVIVVSPPVPPAVSGFTILAFAAVTCTNGSITGDVGTFEALGDAPPGSITQTICPITGGTAQVGTVASKAAFNNFVTTYNNLAATPCGVTLSGTLAGVTLPPGVYCFTAGAAPTGTLTLNGTATDRWLFKIGTSGTGAFTPGSFTVVMAGTALACNVTWWVKQAATLTDSFFNGSVLAGSGVTLIRGSFNGNAWAGASGIGDATVTGPLASAVTGCP